MLRWNGVNIVSLCGFAGIDSFVVASLGRTVRGFKLDGDQHEEAMVPIGGMCKYMYELKLSWNHQMLTVMWLSRSIEMLIFGVVVNS